MKDRTDTKIAFFVYIHPGMHTVRTPAHAESRQPKHKCDRRRYSAGWLVHRLVALLRLAFRACTAAECAAPRKHSVVAADRAADRALLKLLLVPQMVPLLAL